MSQHFDNLIGKLVVWGADREVARHRMLRALGEFEIAGLATTIPADRVLLSQPEFEAATHSTKWVEDELDPSIFANLPQANAAATAAVDDQPELVEQTVTTEVNGKRFSVRLWLPDTPAAGTSSRRRPATRPRPGAASGSGAGNGTITAPMQGTIVKVLVSEGDTVAVGQAVLVLEAMKMENTINSETAGAVREIRVSEGDTVGTGDVLIVIA